MRITLFNITISGISTSLAAGEATPTSTASTGDFSFMNAPVDFCGATVPRTQASDATTCAAASWAPVARRRAVAVRARVLRYPACGAVIFGISGSPETSAFRRRRHPRERTHAPLADQVGALAAGAEYTGAAPLDPRRIKRLLKNAWDGDFEQGNQRAEQA